MKKIRYIFIFSATFLFVFSCSLEEEIYDLATPESALKSAADVDNAIIGVYSHMNNITGFGREAMWLTHSMGDDLSSTAGNEPGIIGRKSALTSGFTLYNNLWVRFYRGVSDANGVLGYLENMDLDPAFEAKAESEARFLRGFFYFNLVQLWGGVPLSLKAATASDDFYIARNSVDEVYEQIFQDLKDGSQNLPDRKAQPASERGRATRQSAHGYLAKAYLNYANYLDLNDRSSESPQYYQLAENYADTVINSNQYELVSDYGQLWDVNSESANAVEIIFASVNTRDAADPSNAGEGGFMVQFFGPQSLNGISGRPDTRGNGFYRVQPWFFERYLQGDYVGDYRVEKTFLHSWTDFQGFNRTVYPFTPTQKNEPQAYIAKYQDGGGLSAFSHENDFPLLRYSEILLIKAEAENELNGPTAEALAAFNQVRARARQAGGTPRTTPPDVQPGLSKEDFRMVIFDERGLEFVAEYNRYFDLKRMRYKDNERSMYEYQYGEFLPTLTPGLPKFENGVWKGGVTEASNIVPYDSKYELFPIPANQISINPQMTQNPRW